jgi:NAD(P)-dependent dehydrogenase (short-subunit alcohol dehydrogenase family)
MENLAAAATNSSTSEMTTQNGGKVCLITGGARGMGREAALLLAATGAHVILVDWEGEAGTRTRDQINSSGSGSAEFRHCDLSSLAEVRRLAASVLADHQRLDILINNAGITDPVRRVSQDGFEMHVATCHLAHFLLTHLLLDLLKASAPARIIMISSEAHRAGPGLDFDDLNNEKLWKNPHKPDNGAAFKAYQRAKLSNLYFMYQLSKRLQGSGVTINAISPGYFVNTTIYRNLRGVFHIGAKLVFGFGTLMGLNTPQRSARTYFWLATDGSLEGVTAKYYEHLKEKETSELSRDEESARQLWVWSAKQTGVGADA